MPQARAASAQTGPRLESTSGNTIEVIPIWARGRGWVAVAAASAGIALTVSCRAESGPGPAESQQQRQPSWIETSGDIQADVLSRHLRGLDVAMIELDHRYVEIYFAARNGNWPYAEYQLEKMRLVMDLAVERRPARAASARTFFYPAIDGLRAAVQQRNATLFDERFEALRGACNGCHAAEEVPTFQIGIPAEPFSSVTAP